MLNNKDILIEDDENQNEIKVQNQNEENLKWYVIHTYSGYENKVKSNIEKIIENRDMKSLISEIIVPIEESIEVTKTGQKKSVLKKIFPGYVFLKMIMNDETWYIVRNTRGVTSFVGPDSKPVALTKEEVISMGIENFLESQKTFKIEEGDVVLIKEGPFANSTGVVKEVNKSKETVIVNVNFFGGRETPVELDFIQVEQI